MKKVFLQYPCGKRWELKVPITIYDNNGVASVILPTNAEYLKYAREKFEINNLKVVEIENMEKQNTNKKNESFISLNRKKTSIE